MRIPEISKYADQPRSKSSPERSQRNWEAQQAKCFERLRGKSVHEVLGDAKFQRLHEDSA